MLVNNPQALFNEDSSHQGVILFSATNQRYYNLDALATFVWQRIQSPITFSDLCSAVIETFDLEPEYVERDLLDLLEEMEHEGLIEAAHS